MTSHLLTSTQKNRAGTTLTEVLMSMMILSIGVLSLAALFPIGILSSIRATQLTHAVTLKHNVANQIDLDPGLILNPDRSNPLAGIPFHYIVDPIGSVRLGDSDGDGLITQGEIVPGFGGGDTNNNGNIDPEEISIPRFYADYNSTLKAEKLAALPDTWTDLAIGAPETFVTRKRLHIDKATNLTGIGLIAQSAQVQLRVMLIDSKSGQSHISLIDSIGGANTQEISWKRQLPMTTASANARINEIRVQQQELKYSCLFTVRKEQANGPASVDVVVFLRRSFILDEERPIGCSTGFRYGEQSITVTNVPVDMSFRPGGYVLDTQNLRWYQIASITDPPATSRIIELQQTIVEDALPADNLAILMPNVIQVFQLGDR